MVERVRQRIDMIACATQVILERLGPGGSLIVFLCQLLRASTRDVEILFQRAGPQGSFPYFFGKPFDVFPGDDDVGLE